MTTKAEKAARATKLRASTAFKEFHQEVLDGQTAVFVNPSSTADEIAEAHAMIRALALLTNQMGRATLAHKIEQKGQRK